MADNVAITAGTGTNIATDQLADSSHAQIIKLAISTDGSGTLIPADSANGLDVDVTRVQGTVTVGDGGSTISVDDGGTVLSVDDGAGSLTVDAPVGTPVFVRLSDGSSAISALPVTDNGGTISIDDGAGSITVDGTVAATQSGTWNIATLTTITNVVHVDDNAGSITVDGAVTVSGTATVTQGTAAAASGAWPVKISDGTDTVGISTVSATKALKVDVVQDVALGVQADKSAFTEGTTKAGVIAGVYNDTISADPTEDQAAAVRITPKRSLHVNIRKLDGTELGISTAPLRTDPTGTTAQPVTDDAGSLTVDAPVGTPVFVRLSDGAAAITALPVTDNGGNISIDDGGNVITVDGTVTVNQGATAWVTNITQIAGSSIATAATGIAKVGLTDESGTAYSDTNPLQVDVVSLGRTRFTNANTIGASETAQAIWTPTSSKKFVITKLVLTITTSGAITVYDATNSAANWVYDGTPPIGVLHLDFSGHPFVSSAINNVLRYTTGANTVGKLQIHGYEVA
jgi:hypothetical protein